MHCAYQTGYIKPQNLPYMRKGEGIFYGFVCLVNLRGPNRVMANIFEIETVA